MAQGNIRIIWGIFWLLSDSLFVTRTGPWCYLVSGAELKCTASRKCVKWGCPADFEHILPYHQDVPGADEVPQLLWESP